MPAVRVDGEAFTDGRIELLGQLLGTSKYDALGRLVYVWSACTRHQASLLASDLVAVYVDPALLIRAGLAEQCDESDATGSKIRIKGTSGRIEWLSRLRENSQKGGLARQAKRLPSGMDHDKPDPSALTPAPTLTIAKKNKRSRAKPLDVTPIEQAVIGVVLGKLGKRTGISYEGSAAHARLIAARLREGYSELDLRKVVSYCADNLGWQDKPEMRPYLRPETLFGPQTFQRYVYPARAWFETLPPSDQPQAEAGGE